MAEGTASSGRPARIVIIAGEHSGDALGAKLMTALAARLPNGAVFSGVGGHRMEEQGFVSDFPLSDIAVMGPIAILKRLPVLVRRVYRSVDAALAADPDVVVIIDAPEFTHPVAKRIRRKRPDIPIIDYVSPTVWAWRPGRARKMVPYVDHVLALLPFEPAAHERLGGPPCTYVGHPLTERIAAIAAIDPADVLEVAGPEVAGLRGDGPLIVILPGSRRSEVERLMPVFGEALGRFLTHYHTHSKGRGPAPRFVLPALPHVRPLIERSIAAWPQGAPRPVLMPGTDETTKFAVFKAARAALAASGTVTLELAMTRTPMVVAYRVDTLVSVFRHLIKTSTSVLPNLITGERAIPEFHQERCTPDNLALALIEAVADTPQRSLQLAELDRVPQQLALKCGASPSAAAAAVVLTYLEPRLRRNGQIAS